MEEDPSICSPVVVANDVPFPVSMGMVYKQCWPNFPYSVIPFIKDTLGKYVKGDA